MVPLVGENYVPHDGIYERPICDRYFELQPIVNGLETVATIPRKAVDQFQGIALAVTWRALIDNRSRVKAVTEAD